MSSRANLHTLVDRLSDGEVSAAERFLEFLTTEPIGEQFAASIRRGMAESSRGETIVCRDEAEMISKILGDPGV